jgi:hypothetical protein
MDTYSMDAYGMDGERLHSKEEVDALFKDPEARRVALDSVGETTVSTVLLVWDHSFGAGPPLIFETMVFPQGPIWAFECSQRYHTREQALAGHRAVLARVLKMELGDDEEQA